MTKRLGHEGLAQNNLLLVAAESLPTRASMVGAFTTQRLKKRLFF